MAAMRLAVPGLILTMFTPIGVPGMETDAPARIPLPQPVAASDVSIEQGLAGRRSVREFARRPTTLQAIGQLLWAAQGVTSPDGRRTAPSAGALYPLEMYVVAGNVTGLDAGVYRYRAPEHALVPHIPGDLRRELARAALGQRWMADGAAVLVITAVYERTRKKYGARTERYVHMEVGHVAQNLYLQAWALSLGTTMVGAFDDDAVATVLELPTDEAPLALLPVGYPR